MADEIQKLKTDIALNQAIVFVGAGVSVYTTDGEQEVAHWKGLLKHGLHRCHQLGHFNDTDLDQFNNTFNSNMASMSDYLLAADLVEGYLKHQDSTTNNDAYKSWLLDTVGKLVPKKPELVRAIEELGCPIFTTNYDILLTHILNRKPLTWKRYSTDTNDNSLVKLNDSILHFYGYFEQPDTIVFSAENYEQFHMNFPEVSKLRSLLETKTLLFIGYDTETNDPSFPNIMKLITRVTNQKPISIYKFVKTHVQKNANPIFDVTFSGNIKEIPYGNSSEELLPFIKSLHSVTPIIRGSLLSNNSRERIRTKYLHYLIREYGNVPILGYSDNNINLPLDSVYVELKFDPTHPSIKAMQTLEIHEEFKRKLFYPGFFNENERNKIMTAVIQRTLIGSDTIYRDFMVDQWLTIFLGNQQIFTTAEATAIKNKINRLKQTIMEKNSFQETQQYRIQRAYNEFKHFIILGHPGSGKTTLSKWLVINMAKECLGIQNVLFDRDSSVHKKIPILIPIWKYIDQVKQNSNQQKKSLLQFIGDNPTFNSTIFNEEERRELTQIIVQSLIQGDILVIFEGLDEVPAHIDRSDLIKDINTLLERGIDYDNKTQQLIYSIYEQKEINNIKSPHIGNRFIITSRIEGNYFEDINFYTPRLTIENMSNDALRLFCSSYIKCIREIPDQSDQLYNDISQNKDIFQLAINPQLASIIAVLYHQCHGQLPHKRIDLYDKAIETMIERLITSTSRLGKELTLNSTLLWSIFQEIAQHLHSKVEGLSESVLQQTIRQCLIEQHSSTIDDVISKLVNIFKYQAGLLNEFGHNSFRFIHRTFQEYLAGKSMIYSNGKQRSEQMIYDNIISKISVPNWRVPLSMTFGILSQLADQNDLFQNILIRLLANEKPSIGTQFSTLLVPFVITDSLNDINFTSKERECRLIRDLADLLLMDYRNMNGFARLKEHQELIHSYFVKLKEKYDQTMTEWLVAKLTYPKNIAACAHLAFQLKWYKSEFHETFLRNLHYDSPIWNWPIDSFLRVYANQIKDNVVTKLKCKDMLTQKPNMIEFIRTNQDWLCLFTALYSGLRNYNTPPTISEYYEISQFLCLSDTERAPFLFYYEEVWGKEDAAYKMAVHLDTVGYKEHWKMMPIFFTSDIYKESFLTDRLFLLLSTEKHARELIEWLRMQINSQTLSVSGQMDGLIALIALGDFHFLNSVIQTNNKTFIKSFANRIEQLISSLKDPIARSSSYISKYLLTVYDHMKINQSSYDVKFIDYCKIYLSLSTQTGALPVNTKTLAEKMENIEDKSYLYAEYWISTFTGANEGDFQNTVELTLNECIASGKSNLIIKSFLKMSDAVQIYKPVRAYAWPLDTFVFQWSYEDDIPIAFFNCFESMNTKLTFTTQLIYNTFINEGYFSRNPQLIPLMILFNLGIVSKDMDSSEIYWSLLPELAEQSDKKEFLLNNIRSMSDPYYKSRALYQLAQLYDQKSSELLRESFIFTKQIPEAVLKFQVLEKIFNVVHYKDVDQRTFIQQIVDELIVTGDRIENLYDRVIAFIRLSFYGSGQFRHKYLKDALQTMMKMKQDDQLIQIIIKLKPLTSLYDDFQTTLNAFIQSLTNKTHQYLAQSQYGRILSTQTLPLQLLQRTIDQSVTLQDSEEEEQMVDCTHMHALFSLFAQLNDVRSIIGETESIDQLWINLFRDPYNQLNVTKILEIALKSELFLTPHVAIIVDELVREGKEDCISVLFPYIIKPPNEVLPVVQRWFTDCENRPIRSLAALLLTESKHVFESAIDIVIDLLQSATDQLRYRAQRVFQHPERDVKEPSKRISVIGERTLIKILKKTQVKDYPPRVRVYLSTFFFDVLWDDPQVFQNLYETITRSTTMDCQDHMNMWFFNKMRFINSETWNIVITLVQSTTIHQWHVEELVQSTITLVHQNQITEDCWTEFARVLSTLDTSQFRSRLYFTRSDVELIQFMVDEISTLIDADDETYFELLESKLIRTSTIPVEDLCRRTYAEIADIQRHNFHVSIQLNDVVLNILNTIHISNIMLENLIKWLMHKMTSFKYFENTWYSLMLIDDLLSLVAACVQKDDYLYRKITNAPHFDKLRMCQLLEKMVHYHSFFPARGSAFIILAALDDTDHQIIVSALNTLFDENLVKEYAMIGIPLIHLSPNELLDDLLQSIKSESAVKTYEILKILTQFVLNETIDADGKSKIINYLANEIEQLKSKKPVNYYYTDIKIPYTTTLENELYKAWIKIQGLSGKKQYALTS